MLVLTAEAALSPLFIHSYRRLGVLAELNPREYRQRPLDERRRGFMLAEAGAAVVLRRLPPGVEPEPGQIELCDTAVACDAHHLIRPSPNMAGLRRVAGRLLRDPVTMLHPHAPGTPDHDAAELDVYRRSQESEVRSQESEAEAQVSRLSARPQSAIRHPRSSSHPTFLYANKGALGHSLGASGLVSLILACLCAKTRRRPPMPWLTHPIPETRDFDISHQTSNFQHSASPPPQTFNIQHPTSNIPPNIPPTHAVFACGFGGHVAGATIGQW